MIAAGPSLFLTVAAATATIAGPVVATDAGPVRGETMPGGGVFRGIRFARAPIGPLRWRPPVKPLSHRAVVDAVADHAACPQPSMATGTGRRRCPRQRIACSSISAAHALPGGRHCRDGMDTWRRQPRRRGWRDGGIAHHRWRHRAGIDPVPAGGAGVPVAPRAVGAIIATRAGLPASATAAQLRALPVATIVTAQEDVDGHVLRETPAAALAAGRVAAGPTIIGVNTMEFAGYKGVDPAPVIAREFPATAPRVRDAYGLTGATVPPVDPRPGSIGRQLRTDLRGTICAGRGHDPIVGRCGGSGSDALMPVMGIAGRC